MVIHLSFVKSTITRVNIVMLFYENDLYKSFMKSVEFSTISSPKTKSNARKIWKMETDHQTQSSRAARLIVVRLWWVFGGQPWSQPWLCCGYVALVASSRMSGLSLWCFVVVRPWLSLGHTALRHIVVALSQLWGLETTPLALSRLCLGLKWPKAHGRPLVVRLLNLAAGYELSRAAEKFSRRLFGLSGAFNFLYRS
jgi:hypothetical protein